MAEVVYKTASDVIAILANENARVAGMSAAEAAAAYGYTKTVSGLYMKVIIGGAAAEAATASSAAAASTAIATTTTTSGCTVALATTSTGTLQAVGVASVALPVASCMAAAAGGYLVGNAIYENNSDFLDKLMFPLYDFITGQDVTSTLYNDVPTTPMLFDVNGNTFLDQRILDSTKAFLDLKYAEPITNSLITKAGTTCSLPINFSGLSVGSINVAAGVTANITSKNGTVYLVTCLSPVDASGNEHFQIYLVSDKSFSGTLVVDGVTNYISTRAYVGTYYHGTS